MVALEIKHSVLNKLVGKNLTIKNLKDILFNLGFDIDNIKGDELKIDITAERIDLLSTQGLARLIKAYLGIKNKKYKVNKSSEILRINNEAEEWSYAIACIVKNLKFDDEKIKEIIKIQEKLHATFLRQRRKGGMGIYPLNKIKFPVTFTSELPEKIKFKPLDFEEILNGNEILEKHLTGKTYKTIMQGWKKYPIFIDSNNKILSMPPIINSHDSGKVDENTRDVFVEATGKDLKTITQALNVLVGALIDMGGECYSLNIEYNKNKLIYPEFKEEERDLEISKVNLLLGLNLDSKKISSLLENMDYKIIKIEKDKIQFLVPANRTDIWHDVDIIDDIARAYGFNNFELSMKNVESIGETTEAVKIKDELSKILIGLEYQEVFTLMLTSKQDQFEKMNIKEFDHIKLGKSVESSINMLRYWLLPELIKVLNNNRSVEYPHKIFEINNVTVVDEIKDVKSKDILKLSIVSSHSNANFTEMKQNLDVLTDVLNLKYEIKEIEHESFISGRVGAILINNKNLGFIGEIHPKVLKNWNLEMPVSALELNLTDLFNF